MASPDIELSTIVDDSEQIVHTIPNPPIESEEIQNHHKKTGCHGKVKEYEGGDGLFCFYCKEEWIKQDYNPKVNTAPPEGCSFKPVAHHYVPTFYFLLVSDTGYYVRWKDLDKLKRGDHVAWLRSRFYWHHGIVSKTVEDHGGKREISFIEYSSKGIREKSLQKNKSPMYKVFYPKEIEEQNPPELVLLRANARRVDKKEDTDKGETDKKESYHLLRNNCEHFATFCKTGSHNCNQLFQYKIKLRSWFARFFVALIRISIAVSFSESIELALKSWVDKDWVGAIALTFFEGVCFLLVVGITYKCDTKRESFEKDKNPQFSKAFRRAIAKNALQSLIMVLFVCVCSVYVSRAICNKVEDKLPAPTKGNLTTPKEDQHPPNCSNRVSIEIGLGFVGGIFGNVIGFFLFYYIPWPCCHDNIYDVENQTLQPTASNTESRERENEDNDNEVDSQNVQQFTHNIAQSSNEGIREVVVHK